MASKPEYSRKIRRLHTRAADVLGVSCTEEVASAQLGGINLYAADHEILAAGIDAGVFLIGRIARAHTSLVRRSLLSLLREEVGQGLEERVFAALVGAALRLGRLDAVRCAGQDRGSFNVLIHYQKVEDFQGHVADATDMLRRKDVVRVSEVRRRIIRAFEANTWSSAQHVLARAAYLGYAEYVNESTFRWPEVL